MKRIAIDRTKCIGCLTCVSACIVSHDAPDSRNRVVIDSLNKAAPVFCRHCSRPECVYTCMTGAMSRDGATGFSTHNPGKCAKCCMCIMACPYGVLKQDRMGGELIMKCDMCLKRINGPACVEKCPMGAIALAEAEE
ncbi:MAG: nitrate reductase [Treponema sp.]|jgi:carbon-monoxide dehydrogenase iron sulfur subunit|nr:nitrate reductase [Treponema sp.]